MPDSRRLRRDRERAPLDLLLTWAHIRGHRNEQGEWEQVRLNSTVWARRVDQDTERDRVLAPEGELADDKRVYILRFNGEIAIGDHLIDGTSAAIIQTIEPLARRRWLMVTCVELDGAPVAAVAG